MDISFPGEKDRFLVIYLDDITVYAKSDEDHLKHLKKVFDKCRKFCLSLNPKKSSFFVQEGKLLGHIVIESGICIDPGRVEAIQKIGFPRNKKELQLFLGKINFLRHFVPKFVDVIKHINVLLKQDEEFKWQDEAKDYFSAIKSALTEAPVLIILDFEKDFLIFFICFTRNNCNCLTT